jgi:hypothetical protein
MESNKINMSGTIPRGTGFIAYTRTNHFSIILDQLQGRETTNIPDKIFTEIKEEMDDSNIDKTDLDPCQLKKILKKLKYSKYYENIPLILRKITGINLFKLERHDEDKIIKMFNDIQEPFRLCCPPTRKSFMNNYYVLYKFLELLNLDSLKSYILSLHVPKNLTDHDDIWEMICTQLNWEFKPSMVMNETIYGKIFDIINKYHNKSTSGISFTDAHINKLSIMVNSMLEAFYLQYPDGYPGMEDSLGFLNYNYVIGKLCDLLGLNDIYRDFTFFNPSVNLIEHDYIWGKICAVLGWEYNPSVTLPDNKVCIEDDAPYGDINWYTISFLAAPNGIDMYGFKVHNGYSTYELANMDAKEIRKGDPNHDIFITQMGKIYSWNNLETVDEMEYDNDDLNAMELQRRQTMEVVSDITNGIDFVSSTSDKPVIDPIAYDQAASECDVDYLNVNNLTALKHGCITIYTPNKIKGLNQILFKVRAMAETVDGLRDRVSKLINMYPNEELCVFEIGKWCIHLEKQVPPQIAINRLNYTMKLYLQTLEEENRRIEEYKAEHYANNPVAGIINMAGIPTINKDDEDGINNLASFLDDPELRDKYPANDTKTILL